MEKAYEGTMQASITDFLHKCKISITVKIDTALASLQTAAPVVERLAVFMRGGKMIRGALVRLGAQLCGNSAVPDEVLDWAGAAMEFFQAGLLIHDDIMDRDAVRRGMPTVYWQYAEDAKQYLKDRVRSADRDQESALSDNKSKQSNPMQDVVHYGEAQGISAGDIAFFLGYYSLERCITALVSHKIAEQRDGACAAVTAGTADSLAFTALELCKVGLAQMLDVQYGTDFFNSDPSITDILEVYRYKTGRYTFSLPLSLGARLAGADLSVCNMLEDYGEQLGIIFQLKDDELGIFAPPEKLGKVSGADIRENKKTIHRKMLFDVPELPGYIKALFGKKDITDRDIQKVQDAMEHYHVTDRVQELMRTYIEQAKHIRENLQILCAHAIEKLSVETNESKTALDKHRGGAQYEYTDSFIFLAQLERYSLEREF